MQKLEKEEQERRVKFDLFLKVWIGVCVNMGVTETGISIDGA